VLALARHLSAQRHDIGFEPQSSLFPRSPSVVPRCKSGGPDTRRREHGPVRPEEGSNLGVLPTHEVPRLSLDENLGDQIHVDGEHNLARPSTSLLSRSDLPSHPTQAKEAATPGGARSLISLKSLSHDKTALGLSARTGLGLGGSKVVGELEKVLPPYEILERVLKVRQCGHALEKCLRRLFATFKTRCQSSQPITDNAV
jgi:hypothetical protein